MSGPTLGERVDALAGAVDRGRDRLPDADLLAATNTVDKVRGRLRHGTEHTVVALAGPTGAGKSSLFNALCGVELSDVGIRRPTTSATHACVWGPEGGDLLDWLGVGHRHHLAPSSDDGLHGLVLLDLPDFDSTAAEHRLEVDRVVELVDLLVWVSDPQKYADDALHHGYLVPLAAHAEIMRFVVNKTDTLGPAQVEEVTADLRLRLDEDGISRPIVFPVAVSTGTGVDEIRRLLVDEVANRTAAVNRIDADLRTAAGALSAEGSADGVSKAGRKALVEALDHAAGVGASADLVAAQHRRDARRATTSPPVRWLKRWGREPVADLPRAGASATATAEIATALRDVGEDAARGLSWSWPAAVRRAAQARDDDVARELTSATVSAAAHHRDRPRWWAMVGSLQRLLAGAALVGLIWLLAVAVLGGLVRLDVDPLLIDTPGADWIPLPSALLVGGVLANLVVGTAARVPAAIGGRRRARRVRGELRSLIAAVADDEVITHVEDVLADHVEMERLLALVAGGR